MFILLFPDPERIGVLLMNSIFEAHTRTSLISKEKIQELWKQGVDQNKLFQFKNMVSTYHFPRYYDAIF